MASLCVTGYIQTLLCVFEFVFVLQVGVYIGRSKCHVCSCKSMSASVYLKWVQSCLCVHIMQRWAVSVIIMNRPPWDICIMSWTLCQWRGCLSVILFVCYSSSHHIRSHLFTWRCHWQKKQPLVNPLDVFSVSHLAGAHLKPSFPFKFPSHPMVREELCTQTPLVTHDVGSSLWEHLTICTGLHRSLLINSRSGACFVK